MVLKYIVRADDAADVTAASFVYGGIHVYHMRCVKCADRTVGVALGQYVRGHITALCNHDPLCDQVSRRCVVCTMCTQEGWNCVLWVVGDTLY